MSTTEDPGFYILDTNFKTAQNRLFIPDDSGLFLSSTISLFELFHLNQCHSLPFSLYVSF